MTSMHAVADGVPLVVIYREPEESFDACAKAFGTPLDKPFRAKALSAFNAFCGSGRPAMYVKYAALDNDIALQAISVYLTGKEIDGRRLKTFQALNITENAPRAAARLASYPQLGLVH